MSYVESWDSGQHFIACAFNGNTSEVLNVWVNDLIQKLLQLQLAFWARIKHSLPPPQSIQPCYWGLSPTNLHLKCEVKNYNGSQEQNRAEPKMESRTLINKWEQTERSWPRLSFFTASSLLRLLLSGRSPADCASLPPASEWQGSGQRCAYRTERWGETGDPPDALLLWTTLTCGHKSGRTSLRSSRWTLIQPRRSQPPTSPGRRGAGTRSRSAADAPWLAPPTDTWPEDRTENNNLWKHISACCRVEYKNRFVGSGRGFKIPESQVMFWKYWSGVQCISDE